MKTKLILKDLLNNLIEKQKELNINELVQAALDYGFEKKSVRNFIHVASENGSIVSLGEVIVERKHFSQKHSNSIHDIAKKAVDIFKEFQIKQSDYIWLHEQLCKKDKLFKFSPKEVREILKVSGKFKGEKLSLLICHECDGKTYDNIEQLFEDTLQSQELPVSINKLIEILNQNGRSYSKNTLHSYVLKQKDGSMERWETGFFLKSRKDIIMHNIQKIMSTNRYDLMQKIMEVVGVQKVNHIAKESTLSHFRLFFTNTLKKKKFIVALGDSDIEFKNLNL